MTDDGYVLLWVPSYPGALSNGYMPFHRYVMEQHLGRKLLPKETVHHKNGIKTDNDLSNLELWNSVHPSGQRVEDLVAFARHILEMYD